MYKKTNGGHGFSFLRLINNAVPNFAKSGVDDADLTPAQKEALFQAQLLEQKPELLSEKAFLVCRVVDNEKISRKVHKSLVQNGCVIKDTGLIDTKKITKNFPNELPDVSSYVHRKVVSLLFFWEEEVARWKLMEQEMAQIEAQRAQTLHETQAADGHNTEAINQLDTKLDKLKADKVLKPSER